MPAPAETSEGSGDAAKDDKVDDAIMQGLRDVKSRESGLVQGVKWSCSLHSASLLDPL